MKNITADTVIVKPIDAVLSGVADIDPASGRRRSECGQWLGVHRAAVVSTCSEKYFSIPRRFPARRIFGALTLSVGAVSNNSGVAGLREDSAHCREYRIASTSSSQ